MIKELNYNLTKDDAKTVSKDVCKLKKFKTDRMKFSIVLSSVASIIALLIMLFIFLKSSDNFIYCISGFIATFVICYIIAYYYKYPKTIEYSLRKMSEGEDLNNITIKIDSEIDYYIVDTQHAEGKWGWKAVKDVYNEKYNILLFVADRKMTSIPKRIFNSEEELNETWNLIQECFNKAKANNN